MLTKLSLAHIAFAPVALLIVEVFGQDGASYQSVFTIHARQPSNIHSVVNCIIFQCRLQALWKEGRRPNETVIGTDTYICIE